MGILRGGLSIRERFAWAVVSAIFGSTLYFLRSRRFDDSEPWWSYVLVGLVSGAFGFVAIQWRLGKPEGG